MDESLRNGSSEGRREFRESIGPGGRPWGSGGPSAPGEAESGEAEGGPAAGPSPVRTGPSVPPESERTFPEDPAVPVGSGEPFPEDSPDPSEEGPVGLPRLAGGRRGMRRGRRLVKKSSPEGGFTPEQRLLVLDVWRRSGLAARDFADLVGVSPQSLYTWKKRFEEHGPAGLMEAPRGGTKGNRLPEATRRAILMLKADNPDWGCQRISDMLLRGPALPASPQSVARVLHEAGYELEDVPTRSHPEKVRTFERARPNQMWQTDLFTFTLKRQNRRVHLVAFLDDHSRFVVGYGLHATASTALVLEALGAAIASYGAPEEILTDNGPQYVTWRGKSAFSKELEKRGIRQVVARPKRPQTLGKVERFWGTLWRECLEAAVFLDLGDARGRIGLFIDHYNFHRPHQGIEGLAPADRFFGAAPDVLRLMRERVAANALELARHGTPKKPFYLAGQGFSVHTEGERVIMVTRDGRREEIELTAPPAEAGGALPSPVAPQGAPRSEGFEAGSEEPPAPGSSPLDGGLRRIAASMGSSESKGGGA